MEAKIGHSRSIEHYARVERERRLDEPFYAALLRVAYEDALAERGSAEAAWNLLGYIRQLAPLALPQSSRVAGPQRDERKRHANAGRVLSEEHKAKLRAAWARRKAVAIMPTVRRFGVAEL